MFFVHQQ